MIRTIRLTGPVHEFLHSLGREQWLDPRCRDTLTSVGDKSFRWRQVLSTLGLNNVKAPMKRFLTPQEKKVLRYKKDRRNGYGESRARSRKAIATRKALASRSLRHAEEIATSQAARNLDEADLVVRRTGKNSWRKYPDAPLADHVGRTLRFRALKAGTPPPLASALLRQARRRLPLIAMQFKGPLQHPID